MNVQELDAYDVHESELYTSLSTWHGAALWLPHTGPTQRQPHTGPPTVPHRPSGHHAAPVFARYPVCSLMITMLPHR